MDVMEQENVLNKFLIFNLSASFVVHFSPLFFIPRRLVSIFSLKGKLRRQWHDGHLEVFEELWWEGGTSGQHATTPHTNIDQNFLIIRADQ